MVNDVAPERMTEPTKAIEGKGTKSSKGGQSFIGGISGPGVVLNNDDVREDWAAVKKTVKGWLAKPFHRQSKNPSPQPPESSQEQK